VGHQTANRARVLSSQEEEIMNEERDLSNRMRAITISREYGSGGGEIASHLAKRLGWDVIDHAIVERTARVLGTSIQEAEAHDESTGGIIMSLSVMQNLYPAPMVSAPPEAFLSTEDYWRTVDRIVRAAAARGDVVIVGRASQVILADLHDVLHVRIIAPFEKRVATVMQREGVDCHTATSRNHRKDHERASYLEREYITTQTMRICTTSS